jgi:hypothetical protein
MSMSGLAVVFLLLACWLVARALHPLDLAPEERV